MSTAPAFPLTTVTDYQAMPEPGGESTFELHFGEVVQVGRPKHGHYNLQRRIRELLRACLDEQKWMIDIEVPYGLTSGYDARAAGVAVKSREGWDAVPEDGMLIGSPELVIQVKSPSNRDAQMEREAIDHLTHGALAVWLVRPEQQQVTVLTASGKRTLGRGELLTADGLPALCISIDGIFA